MSGVNIAGVQLSTDPRQVSRAFRASWIVLFAISALMALLSLLVVADRALASRMDRERVR